MELLLLLLTAHFVADFYLPSSKWNKAIKAQQLTQKFKWKHAGVHSLLNILVFVFAALTLPVLCYGKLSPLCTFSLLVIYYLCIHILFNRQLEVPAK